jgi:uncharacterized protein affecting Mg2+/Co2+ transport
MSTPKFTVSVVTQYLPEQSSSTDDVFAFSYTITIRNDEFQPYTSSVTVVPGQPVSLKYRFGS